MKFITIDPKIRAVTTVIADSLEEVYPGIGLKSTEVDHGTIFRDRRGSISIVVYEYGLFKPPEQGHYFSIRSQLYEGGAVLYAANAKGKTVSLKIAPSIVFYRSAFEVENAIRRGEINRPYTGYQSADANVITWQWPEAPRTKN